MPVIQINERINECVIYISRNPLGTVICQNNIYLSHWHIVGNICNKIKTKLWINQTFLARWQVYIVSWSLWVLIALKSLSTVKISPKEQCVMTLSIHFLYGGAAKTKANFFPHYLLSTNLSMRRAISFFSMNYVSGAFWCRKL